MNKIRRNDSFFEKKEKILIIHSLLNELFQRMKIVKTRLYNRVEDDFLANYLIVYIEKEIAERFTIDMIIDDFYSIKERRAQLK
jgi:hypothetical protein